MDFASRKTQDLAGATGFAFSDSAWLPDGRGLFVLYRDQSTSLKGKQIGFVTYPGGKFHEITNDMSSYESLTLSADAKTLATVQVKQLYTLYAIPAKGTPANLYAAAMPQIQKAYLNFSWADDNAFYFADGASLAHGSAGGSNQTTIRGNIPVKTVSACPDGETLLLALRSQGGRNATSIWRLNRDGTNLTPLSNGTHDDGPECSIDSKWAYYIEENTNRVKRVPVEGGTPETLPGTPIPHALISGSYVDLSPDGKSVALLIELGEGNPVHKIAVVPLAGFQPKVRLLDADPNVSDAPRFTPDGRGLVYPLTQNGSDTLWLQPLDGSPGRPFTNFKTGPIVALRWSPDGKKIGVLTQRIDADVVLLRQWDSAAQ
jgi:hypothetical protein